MCILIEVSFEFRLNARSRSVERVVDGQGDAEQARAGENGGELHVFCQILRGKQALVGVSCKEGFGEMLIDEGPTDESYLILGPLESKAWYVSHGPDGQEVRSPDGELIGDTLPCCWYLVLIVERAGRAATHSRSVPQSPE